MRKKRRGNSLCSLLSYRALSGPRDRPTVDGTHLWEARTLLKREERRRERAAAFRKQMGECRLQTEGMFLLLSLFGYVVVMAECAQQKSQRGKGEVEYLQKEREEGGIAPALRI